MSNSIIEVNNISKLYRIGLKEESNRTFGEVLLNGITSPLRNIKKINRLTKFKASNSVEQEKDIIWALKNVSFNVEQGQVLGIIGKNGAGKSTLLKILSCITEPSSGLVKIRGRVASLLEVGTGFHPELTGRENIFLNGAILGMRKWEIKKKFDEIVEFAEIEKFIDTPVKRYSSGMYVRLAFAVAAHLEAEILLMDEVLAVGDIAFQKKCLGKMGDVVRGGRTVLFVSHNMGAILELCDSAIFINQGEIVKKGITTEIVRLYQNSFKEKITKKEAQSINFSMIKIGLNEHNIIQYDEPLTIFCAMNSDLDIIGYSLYCIIENARGEIVIHSRIDSAEVLTGNHKGKLNIKLTYPKLWLNPGIYSMYFKFLVQGIVGDRGRYFSDKISFTVVGKSNIGETVLNPPAKWEISNQY